MTVEPRNKIIYLPKELLQKISPPEKFTYPFWYEPHPLTKWAATDLQGFLLQKLGDEKAFSGKMFGVLVVKDKQNRIGYLSAFSGKLENSNAHARFVPPVFDRLTDGGFFRKGEEELNQLNHQIEKLENALAYKDLKLTLKQLNFEAREEISSFGNEMKRRKAERKKIRESKKNKLSEVAYRELEKALAQQSNFDQFRQKMLKNSWKSELDKLEIRYNEFESEIELLKLERRQKSFALQNRLFEQYTFLNHLGETKSLSAIFGDTIYEKPPSGAGECAGPKLLQFAFLHDLKPLCFGEFWWGKSPQSEIRKHKKFYPSCAGKCRPILKHMLQGIELEENPILKDMEVEKQLKIIYEDDALLVVDKPFNLLSIPGIEVQDSVYTRLQEKLKDIEPLIVHRLDMATSGLMVVAKTKEAHKKIQHQFISRKIKKRYLALLDGEIEKNEGEIRLPLCPDFLNRPQQKVSFEHGKKAITHWKVIQKMNNKTLVNFFPVTGRTHQLRVHAAHPDGLNSPIIGDDLYGDKSERLCLHADLLEFHHPKTSEWMRFELTYIPFEIIKMK